MPLGDPIPPVSDNQLILTTWGNAVKDEINSNSVKKVNGSQSMAGPLVITGFPGLDLRRTGNGPVLRFAQTDGVEMAHLQAVAGGLRYHSDLTGGNHVFYGPADLLLAVIDAAGNLQITGGLDMGAILSAKAGIFARNDGANQLVLADYQSTTAGVAAHAYLSFYPDAVSATSFGSRGGYFGFNGEGFQMQADIGPAIIQSLAASVDLDGQTAVTHNVNSVEIHRTVAGGIYLGKTTSDDDIAGVAVLGPAAAAGFRNSIRGTANAAGNPNVYLRRTGTAVADNQIFVQFTKDSGTTIGSITMNGTAAVQYNLTSDYRMKDDLGPIEDPVGKVMALQPKRLRWKPDATEFDGFIAHEVEAAAPYAVSGAKDAVLPPDDPHDPGGIDPQQLDRAALVPLLTAALQGALTQIEALEARVAALEGTPA